MTYLIVAAGLLTLGAPAPGTDKTKPNTLTPQEVADGWILLFDGRTTFGWKSTGPLKVENDTLIIDGKKKEALAWTSLELTRYQVEYEIKNRGEFKKQSFDQNTKTPTHACPVAAVDGTRAILRNVKIKPLGTKPLFNGKDLAGWKKYEGDARRSKSQFTVTKEGWLHLQNGPGDLQTEGQWADFVLQLECRSNGKFLNSGAFFRCLPGQYQNGYEAQIHNNFTADPPKEYAVDEYDPKTHAKKGTAKVKSAATDYGTGAVYRRVPARGGVAKDGEWFTMTVVAHGRHIATWVNGVQQVDWTDNRPPHENPRNGCRVEKGAISLQGHDPTTDLLFRNIRLVELPPEK